MRSLQGAGNLDRRGGLRLLARAAPAWLTLEVLQHQIVGSYVVHLANVGVVERRDRPRLALESLAVLGRQLLDRHDAVEPGIEGLVDLAHATSANGRLDFVGAETCTGCERQRLILSWPRPRVTRKRALIPSSSNTTPGDARSVRAT